MLTDDERYQLLRAVGKPSTSPSASSPPNSATAWASLTIVCGRSREKGWVKAENFRNSQNKSAYFYKHTPAGVTETARVTRRFLQCNLEEHREIEREINALKEDVAQQTQTP